MIDFRYHIVSLTAVFLALAVGVILGTSALRGPVLNDLHSRVNSLAQENRTLRSDLHDVKDRSTQQEQFAAQVAPAVVAGRLAGQTVTVISGPGGGAGDRDAVVSYLAAAGAKVVSRVRLAAGLTDPGHSAEIKSLVSQLLPAGVQVPVTPDGAAQAGALLGSVLVAPAAGAPTVAAAGRSAVVQGFASLGLLSVDGTPAEPADLAVVVASPPATGAAGKLRNAGLFSFVTQLDAHARRTVVAMSSADGNGNVVAAIRADDRLVTSLSTVDDVATAAGRVAVVLALVDERRGRSGQYGMAGGATAGMPALSQ